jgi:hypoxanthine-guanine phosphoribosyltransferase
VCTLLDRPARRIVPLDVRYRGEEIPDVFVLGYGLHYADLYRNLPVVVEADPRALREDPGAFVPALYRRHPAA